MARELNDTLVGGVSISSAYTSEAVELLFLDGYSISAKWSNLSGVSGASIKLEGSNVIARSNAGKAEASTDEDDWFEICGSSRAITATGGRLWNVMNAKYRWVRISVAISAGSFDLTAYINGKAGG